MNGISFFKSMAVLNGYFIFYETRNHLRTLISYDYRLNIKLIFHPSKSIMLNKKKKKIFSK